MSFDGSAGPLNNLMLIVRPITCSLRCFDLEESMRLGGAEYTSDFVANGILTAGYVQLLETLATTVVYRAGLGLILSSGL